MLHHVQFPILLLLVFLFCHQQPSALTSICSLLVQLLMCSIFTAFSLSHLPSSLLEGGIVAVRTHIPYSPTPVRSASIYSCAGFSLFFRGPSDQYTSPSARSRVLLLISLKLVLLKNLVTNLQ